MDKSTDDLISEFVAVGGDFADWKPGWNIRPTDAIPVVIDSDKDETVTRRLELARWSLTPGWSKTLKTKQPLFNARSEGITEKASFKGAVKSKRALIPASGYYEWQTDPETGVKTPYFMTAPDGGLLAFAGLYSWWRDHSKADDDPARWVLTSTILTADAVHTLDDIHDRNPVPLPRDWWDHWLDPKVDGTQELVDEAVAAAVGVAERLDIQQILAVNDEQPVGI